MVHAPDSPWAQVFGFAVLDHVPVGSCVLDSRLRVVFWNKVLEHWTGIDRWSILNREITEFFPHFDQPQYRFRLEEIFKGGPPLVLSSQLHGQTFPSTCSDGRLRLQHTTVTSIPTYDGTGCLACFAVEDVTEVTRRIADLKETRDQAEKLAFEARRANAAKSQFLANMSHELRTPLNSILLLSGMMLEEGASTLEESERHSVQIISQSGEALLQLVNDILDFSKGEAGRREVVAETVALPSFLDYIVDSLGLLVTHKGLEFHIEVDPAVPETFVTDQQALIQITRNLLSNAAKFTRQGRVALRVWMESPDWFSPEEVSGPWLALAVQDTGPGIALDRQETVFEPFCQEDGTISREYGGTGLGLSISRQLTDLLGGRLLLDSRPGEGSTFTLYLPPRQPRGGTAALPTAPGHGPALRFDRGPGPAASRPDPGPVLADDDDLEGSGTQRLAGRRILVADQDMRSLFILSGILEQEGAEVLTAGRLEDALIKLDRNPGVDLVLVDLPDPDPQGRRLVTEIRRRSADSGLPVLCLACLGQRGGRDCADCLVDGMVPKPINRQALFARIEELLPQAVAAD